MDNQTALDLVWDWFVRRRNPPGMERQSGGGEACVLYTKDKPTGQPQRRKILMCAVGCLARDNPEVLSQFKANPNMEMHEACALLNLDSEFGEGLRTAHDTIAMSKNSSDFHWRLREELEVIAECYDLTIPNDNKK